MDPEFDGRTVGAVGDGRVLPETRVIEFTQCPDRAGPSLVGGERHAFAPLSPVSS